MGLRPRDRNKAPARATIEWIVGTFPMPPSTGLGPRWVILHQGLVVAQAPNDGESPAAFLASVLAREGQRAPTQVRVAAVLVDEALRETLGKGIALVVAPTPEVDRLGAMVADDHEAMDPSYLLGGRFSAASVGAMLASAVRFGLLEPYGIFHVPVQVGVTIEALGIHGAVLETLGSAGVSRGFMVYENVDALLNVQELAVSGGDPSEVMSGVMFALNFDPPTEIPPKCEDELAKYRWPMLPGEAAWVTGPLRSGGYQAPSPRAQLAVWAMTEALGRLVAQHAEGWMEAYYGADPTVSEWVIEAVPGLPTVVLTVPALPHDDELEELDEGEGDAERSEP